MKKLVFLFLIISSAGIAQELKLKAAKMLTVRVAETSLTSSRCFIDFSKDKKFKWSIDSLVSVATGKKISYGLLHVDDPEAVSPDYKAVKSFTKKDLGNYRISFTPERSANSALNTDKGVIMYYTAKRKAKQLKIGYFEKPEPVETP